MRTETHSPYEVIIIGAGFAGLCMGVKLRDAGQKNFLILEKADDLGGTWRENTYPGAACDIPSALYSYSFAHNSDWKSIWSGQAQILAYQHAVAEQHQLEPHIRYQQHINALQFDADQAVWNVTTTEGAHYQARHVVSAVGQLHHPSVPTIPNAAAYTGTCFHSAQWRHDVDLEGKHVAVIGNAASAVQFIPEVAEQAAQMTVFQRSPNWILPKVDRNYAKWEQRLSARAPKITRLYRWLIWALGEYVLFPAIQGKPMRRWFIKQLCLRNLRRTVKDPELRRKLTPDYPVGAKRVLFGDRYFPALTRDNVTLCTDPITAFTQTGLQTKTGSELEFDVVIYGTGFKTNPFLADIEVLGRDQQRLHSAWSEGAHAYLGISTHGFPNLHFLYGPNTNLGHTSILIMLEAQADYVMRLMTHQQQLGLRCGEVRDAQENEFNAEVQRRMQSLAFSEIATSWYMHDGKITNNWVGGTREYQQRLAAFAPDDYQFW